MKKYLIKNIQVVNGNKIETNDVLIHGERFEKIDKHISSIENVIEINGEGKYLIPGLIDDQVHFREPGLTHKGNIYSEAKAAVAGGITTYMEMPNTKPPTLNKSLLEEKYAIAQNQSLANYSFYMGASNDNLDNVLGIDYSDVCGIKVFMGSSTGNMLVDNELILDNLFRNAPVLIATHCEDEHTIQHNLAIAKAKYGELIPIHEHPIIRSREACLISSSKAIELAKKHQTRLHILHISTAAECDLFSNKIPLKEKRITAEACIHHLWFDERDYEERGNFIKWNPAIKSASDKNAIWNAVLDGRIDVIATDHAPHTLEEKNAAHYTQIPSGGPLVQHSLQAMLSFYKEGKISLENIVNKMCHDVAICFQIKERGFIQQGFFADAVILDLNEKETVSHSNILYSCGWSPFEGETFIGKGTHTFVSGHLVYHHGKFDESVKGHRISFNR